MKKGVMDSLSTEHPYPGLSPSRGKVSDAVIAGRFHLSVSERKIMNHFVVNRQAFIEHDTSECSARHWDDNLP